jgi:hypothetical protein
MIVELSLLPVCSPAGIAVRGAGNKVSVPIPGFSVGAAGGMYVALTDLSISTTTITGNVSLLAGDPCAVRWRSQTSDTRVSVSADS